MSKAAYTIDTYMYTQYNKSPTRSVDTWLDLILLDYHHVDFSAEMDIMSQG